MGEITGKLLPHMLPALVVFLVTFALYAGCLGHDFHVMWDDNLYVTANEAAKGVSLQHLKFAFTTNYSGNYAPFQIISYMLDYDLWGMRPFGFILTNILLQAVNGILLYALLVTIDSQRLQALAAALLFAVHPLQVESVAWISQRKTVLAMTFFLIAFLLYLRYREKGWRGAKWAYVCSVISFSASLLTKSVVVILPAALFLYDIRFSRNERRRWWSFLPDKLPYLVPLIPVVVMTLLIQRPEAGGGRVTWHGGTPVANFLTMLTVFPKYVGLVFWPTGLSAYYDLPIKTVPDLEVLGSVLLLALLACVGAWLWLKHRRRFFWFALFWLGLLPVSQIVPLVTIMNDRYLYFPMIGVAALFGSSVPGVGARYTDRQRLMVTTLLFSLLIPLAIATLSRSKVWENDESLWIDAVRKFPTGAANWTGLANAYRQGGKPAEAEIAYGRALQLQSNYQAAMLGLGQLYVQQNDAVRARAVLEKLIGLKTQYFEAYEAYGHSFYLSGDITSAELAYKKAISMNPAALASRHYLGNIYLRAGRTKDARTLYEDALAKGGMGPDLAYSLACLEALEGNRAMALYWIEQAFIRGFRDIPLLLRNRELQRLWGDPEFNRLLKHYGEGRKP